jgi:hypothetical protein
LTIETLANQKGEKNFRFETFLFGLLGDWDDLTPNLQKPSPNAHLLLSYTFYKQLCDSKGQDCFMDFVPKFTPQQWRLRLTTLCRSLEWAFIDNFMEDNNAFGVTWAERGGLITIDVGLLRHLIGDDVTLAERCILHVVVATTVRHQPIPPPIVHFPILLFTWIY